MIQGRWIFRLQPQQGELFSSLLTRNAHAHASEAYRFTNLFWPGRAIWNRDVDRCGDKMWFSEVAGLLGMPSEQIAAMSLERYRLALDPDGSVQRGDLQLLLSAGVFHRVRRRHAVQYCPACLAEDRQPYFRRMWRLGFLTLCPKHGASLLDACTFCDAPIMPHRTLPGRLTLCQDCGTSLITATPPDMRAVSPSLLAMQHSLLTILNTGACPDPLGPWCDATAFQGVRTLIAVAAMPCVSNSFRASLALPHEQDFSGSDIQFEHARLIQRNALLETCVVMLADWPRSFRDVAGACGLTKRTFARARLPSELADEVRRLPDGLRRPRVWTSIINSPEQIRLRRVDPDAWRAVRALNLLAVCQPKQTRVTRRSTVGRPPIGPLRVTTT
jgi:hypothetical protein